MVIPLLAIPVISRPDLLARCIASIDAPVGRLVVIDNGLVWNDDCLRAFPTGEDHDPIRDWVVTEAPSNLGVAASWNLAIRTAPALPWWAIANADVEFAPGDLGRLAAEMQQGGARWVGINDWSAFGLSREAVQRVGWYDESFFPVYCEDADYEYRCTLAGVPWYFIRGGTTHAGSATIADPRYGSQNARTYPDNRRYYRMKWGGDLRGGETFTTPFDLGGPVSSWTLDIDRLRDNAWR